VALLAALAPKHHLSDEEATTPEETPQKRRKKQTLLLEIVEAMEQRMDRINRTLPDKYAMHSGLYEMPRGLLERGTSIEEVLTKLGMVRRFCRARVKAMSVKLNELTSGEDADPGRFLFRL
jgi:hypothetical protein